MKTFKHKLFLLLFVGLVSIGLAGCGNSSSEDVVENENSGSGTEGEKVTWKYHNPLPEDSISGRYATKLAEEIGERTNDRIQIEVFHNGVLGTHQATLEASSTGSIEMGLNDFSNIGTLYPEIGVYGLPTLYEDIDHAVRVFDLENSELFKQHNEELIEATNIRILGAQYYGARQFTANKEVLTPEDASGLKIRAQNKVSEIIANGLGGTPVSVDFSELSTALATNVVDGQENPVGTILDNHFYESQDYLMMTNHTFAFLLSYINNDAWNKISEEDQKIINEVMREMQQWTIETLVEEEKEATLVLESKGMNIITEEEGLQTDAFKSSFEKAINSEFPEWEDVIIKIKSM